MKPNNKLGRVEFEPEQAFENLRKLARRVLATPKKQSKPKSIKSKAVT